MSASDRAADRRLAIYGSLAPGQVNHDKLAGLKGRWRPATVRGWLGAAGWAAPLGHPGLVLDPLGPLVELDLFESPDLPDHWPRLDSSRARITVGLARRCAWRTAS